MALVTTRRVSRGEPCPVCGRSTWCLISRDGRYAVCNRVQSDRPAQRALGGWIHGLGPGDGTAPRVAAALPLGSPVREVAPLGRRDRVYRRLLGGLPLSDRHRDALLARGCAPAEVAARGYGTLPLAGRARACREVAELEYLAGVPGFFAREGGRGEYVTLAGSPGLLIPVRAPDGRVRALRIRPDDQEGGGKYRWLSSGDRPGGTGSGAHCHVARPLGPVRDDAVWVTEGEIKADLASQRLGAVVVSVPGVDLWSRALADLAELLPGGGRVVVALDSDWPEKPAVHAALWSLVLASQALGYRAEVALWDVTHKGLDDLLVAGLVPEVRPPGAVPALPWTWKTSSRPMAILETPPAPPIPIPMMRARLETEFRAWVGPRRAAVLCE